jgi:hypothetical protein
LADDNWSAPAPGTLAGEKVQLGELFDNPAMAAAGPTQGYYEYRGSGFQHLFNVQRRTGGDAVVDYVHEKDPAAALRIRVLAAPGLSLMAADARVSPVKDPHLLKYLIARHEAKGGDSLLRSEFVSVLEPHAPGETLMSGATRLAVSGGGRAVLLTHANGAGDIVIHDPAGGAKTVATAWGPITTDARLAVVRLSADGRAARVFFAGGSGLAFAGQSWDLSASAAGLTGEVVAVDPAKSEFRLRLADTKSAAGVPDSIRMVPAAGRFAGWVVTLGNGFACTAHTLMAARDDGDEVVLTLQDDLLAGLMRVTAVAGPRLETKAQLPFAPSYAGATVYDDAFRPLGRIRSAELDHLILEAPPADGAALVGRDVWIGSVGPGDRLDLPAVFTWQR